MSDKKNATVAAELEPLLPQPLISYLWRLTELETQDVDGALVECRLTPVNRSGEAVQQIDFFGEQHHLSGFSPVCCSLYIIVYPSGEREIIPAHIN